MDENRPERLDISPVIAATILREATETTLREAFEPQLAAQQAFWNVVTAFLAKHGSLLYEQPNFDLPHFTTGPMALEQAEIDAYGRTHAVPSVQVSSHEGSLIHGYFGKRARNPLTRFFPPSEEKIRDEIRTRYAAEALKNSPRFPYIEIKTRYVSFAEAYDGGVRGAAGQYGGMHGSRVPKVLLNESDLPILPNVPPPNTKYIHDCSRSFVRLGPPTSYEIALPEYDPDWQTEDMYSRSLAQESSRLVELRDWHINSMAEITDILSRADQIQTPLYEHLAQVMPKE